MPQGSENGKEPPIAIRLPVKESKSQDRCLLAGARIAMTIPMTAEAVVAYLGIVLAGCAVVAIADSFSAAEIASRLRIGGASAIITQVIILCPCRWRRCLAGISRGA